MRSDELKAEHPLLPGAHSEDIWVYQPTCLVLSTSSRNNLRKVLASTTRFGLWHQRGTLRESRSHGSAGTRPPSSRKIFRISFVRISRDGHRSSLSRIFGSRSFVQ